MTGTKRSSADLDPRRRRILFRAWHRGIREMDLVLGQFVDAEIATLSDAQLDELERIMSVEDQELNTWVNGSKPTPAEYDTPMFRRIINYKPDFDPVGQSTGDKKQ